MKIQELSTDQLHELVNHVEETLRGAPKPTKALIVRTLAERGHCSAKSTGTEHTLIKAMKAKNVGIPAALASLMGEQSTAVTKAVQVTKVTKAVPAPAGPPPPSLLSMTGGVSMVKVNPTGDQAEVFYVGGSSPVNVGCNGATLERNLRSNFILIEFSES